VVSYCTCRFRNLRSCCRVVGKLCNCVHGLLLVCCLERMSMPETFGRPHSGSDVRAQRALMSRKLEVLTQRLAVLSAPAGSVQHAPPSKVACATQSPSTLNERFETFIPSSIIDQARKLSVAGLSRGSQNRRRQPRTDQYPSPSPPFEDEVQSKSNLQPRSIAIARVRERVT